MSDASNLGYVAGINLDTDLFTEAELLEEETKVAQVILDYAPSLKLTRGGTLYDLVVRPRALLNAIATKLNKSLQSTQSLQGVVENPELAVDEVVDAILSNRGIKRRIGSKATGTVRVNVSRNDVYSLHSDLTFVTATGLVFLPQQSYRATVDPQNDTDLTIYATGDQFYFLVPVIAQVTGAASRLIDVTELLPSPTIPNLISSFAFGSFQGGENDETNEELLAREPEALAAKNHVSAVSISSTLKDQFTFVRDVSVQGMNSLGMSRNASNLLSFKMGGYADVYVRTAQAASYGQINKTATLVEIEGTTKATYSLVIDRDDFPGHFFVSKIGPAGSDLVSSYLITSEEKTADLRTDGQIHHVPASKDAVYTRYQKNTVLFEIEFDETLGTNPVDQFPATLAVTAQVAYLPGIKEIQDFLSDPTRGVVLSDYLAKAPVPCFVHLSPIRVHAPSSVKGEDVRLAVFDYINGLPFGSEVRVDEILSVIKAIADVKRVDLPIRITGDIYCPDGVVRTIRDDNALGVPSLPEVGVVPETTAFFVELSDIPIAMIEV